MAWLTGGITRRRAARVLLSGVLATAARRHGRRPADAAPGLGLRGICGPIHRSLSATDRTSKSFRPWGWGANRFVWDNRTVIINDRPWGLSWVNRPTYVHPYEVRRYEPARRMESHELHRRSERKRDADRSGHERAEEHRRR
jgi:hypothetical protein